MTAIIDPKHPVNDRIGVVKSGPKPSATNTRPGLTLKIWLWTLAALVRFIITGIPILPFLVVGCPFTKEETV